MFLRSISICSGGRCVSAGSMFIHFAALDTAIASISFIECRVQADGWLWTDIYSFASGACFVVADPSAGLEEVLNHLKDLNNGFSDLAGIPNSINTRADGVKQIYFQDPNGYWIEVNNGYVATSKEMNVKDTIWKLEEDYWVYVKNKDFANYLNLWDDDFIGYPSTNIIGGKANITDWMTDMYKTNKGTFSYELERKVENVFGDIVIVLYDATTWWKGSNGEILSKTNYKLTHTWKKTEVGWKIIGGMGGKK
jgi:ketosteroid isomerase-like protein